MANNMLAERKLQLTAEPHPNAEDRNGWKVPPRLIVSVYDNQPRFTVFTGVVNDLNNGRIEANMDSPTMFALLQGIREVAEGKSKGFSIENHNYTFGKSGRSEKPRLISTTVVGFDDNNCMFIAVLAYGDQRPKIRFRFGPSEYHRMVDSSGAEVSINTQSRLFAHGWANLIEAGIKQVLHSEHISAEDIKKRKEMNARNRGGGNGGGYNRSGYNNNSGGGGNYNNNSSGGGYKNNNSGGSASSGDDDAGETLPW